MPTNYAVFFAALLMGAFLGSFLKTLKRYLEAKTVLIKSQAMENLYRFSPAQINDFKATIKVL